MRPPPHAAHRPSGHSLLELMSVLTLIAILATLAVPGFGPLFDDARLSRASNALLGALHFARLQALVRGVPVVLCASNDGRQCLTRDGTARGWLVFVDTRRGSPVQRDADDELLQNEQLPASVLFSTNRPALSYWPQSRAGTTATLTLCAAAGHAASRAVIVSQSGRPRTSRTGASGEALNCR